MASEYPLRRTIRRVLAVYGLILFAVLLLDLHFLRAGEWPVDAPRHHRLGGFRNVAQDYSYPLLQRMRGLLHHRPAPRHALTLVSNDGAEIRHHAQGPAITWIGHSTFLVQIGGLNVLTDPHWGDRASPVRFAGPRRLIPPGVRFEDLPAIGAVVISHDHYDHLDDGTVRRLAREHHPRFFVPLRVGAWLASRGIDDVVELDWWGHADFRGLTFTCTPAQHSSGRGLDDQNRRLWSSWVIAAPTRRFFFAGDTGYYDGLREIGDRLGPF